MNERQRMRLRNLRTDLMVIALFVPPGSSLKTREELEAIRVFCVETGSNAAEVADNLARRGLLEAIGANDPAPAMFALTRKGREFYADRPDPAFIRRRLGNGNHCPA